ncbi:methyltransferase [Lithospermum erythrorhizon]|uniref:Methyltransferase n=1 Tax=Lithospermum erythrorhizon TaxID=34254 RepID=A0AAV3Q3V7_LITER
MGGQSQTKTKFTKEEEAQAEIDVWKYVFGFTDMAIVKCAIELGIADVLETQDEPVTLEDLSSLLGCHTSPLHRIMRFLTNRGIFKEDVTTEEGGHICYTQTPMSRLLRRGGDKSLGAFILLESSPPMLAPWHELSSRVMIKGSSAFEGAHGEDVWTYAANNPTHSKLINDAMSSHARISVPVIIEHCPEVFEGVNSLVDVGGGDGTTLQMLVKAFPWIHGINFDLPHVISTTTNYEGLENVGGDMFVSIPKADAIYIMWVLHDWGDDECIRILKNCRESIPKDTGKVIMAEAVIDLEEEKCKQLANVSLMLDMVMLAHTTNGKERTTKEWASILNAAGFSSYTFKRIQAVQSLIIAYP